MGKLLSISRLGYSSNISSFILHTACSSTQIIVIKQLVQIEGELHNHTARIELEKRTLEGAILMTVEL